MQILVADNNDHTRSIICQMIENEGHQAVAAETADDALRLFGEKEIMVVILDLVLVGMSSLELLEKFKTERPDCEVITMTSFPSLESVVGAMNLGALDYLIKTDDSFESIVTTLNQAVEKVSAKEQRVAEINTLQHEIDRLKDINRNLITGTRDTRTGLHGTDYFDDAFDAEFHRASQNQRQFSIVLVKLNPDIQLSGDQFQVRALDQALPSWTKLIHERLRKSDIVARYDDHTLSIILPETGKPGALLVAECLIQLCDEVIQTVLGQEIEIADLLQVGIASFPDDGNNKDKLFDLASKRSDDISPGTIH